MIVKAISSSLSGINAYIVDVEVDISLGLPSMSVVGLPDKAIDEARERVRSSIKNSNFIYPAKKIVVNLAPANKRKDGTLLDLSIAIGLLAASEQVPSENLKDFMIIGELSLDGTIRPVNGVLCYAIAAKENGIEAIILPEENAEEASVISELKVYPVKTLRDAVEVISHKESFVPLETSKGLFDEEISNYELDFEDVKGQEIFCTKIMCNSI